eukprot:Awhi_evm1s14652
MEVALYKSKDYISEQKEKRRLVLAKNQALIFQKAKEQMMKEMEKTKKITKSTISKDGLDKQGDSSCSSSPSPSSSSEDDDTEIKGYAQVFA